MKFMSPMPLTDAGAASAQQFALDVQGVDALRRSVYHSPQQALQQVSNQFEALFMNMVLKSMREATPASGLLDSAGERLYQSLLDQQLVQNLSGHGLGLAEAMRVQLARYLPQAAATDQAESVVPALPLESERMADSKENR